VAFSDYLNGTGCHKAQRYPEPSVEREEKYRQRARLYFLEAKDDIKEVGYILTRCRGLVKILDFVRLEIKKFAIRRTHCSVSGRGIKTGGRVRRLSDPKG